MKLNATEKNLKGAVEYILWAAKVKVSSIGIEEDLILHPNFPSLAAISDALNEWQVPNLATRLSIEQLKTIPLPALAYLNVRGGLFAPIKAISNDCVEWLDTLEGWQEESVSTFAQHWDGTCLLIEPGAISGEVLFKANQGVQNRRNARILFLMIGIAIVVLFGLSIKWEDLSTAGDFYLYTLVLKFVGSVIGGFLLWQCLEVDSPFLQSLCYVGGNCNSILQSPAAKITSWLSWSEVGFLYFTGGFISLFVAPLGQQIPLWSGLGVLSLITFPYTLYSLWYQGFVARQWCVLCTAAQAILWFEVLVVLFQLGDLHWVVSRDLLIWVALCFVTPALIWIFVKAPLTGSGQVFDLRRELHRIKFNESYIQALFGKQPEMPPIFEGMRTVKLGNADAAYKLTVVTNPLCGPCAAQHKEIEALLKVYAQVSCEFVFLGSQDGMRIASAFLGAVDDQVAEIMHSWYANPRQNVETWLKQQVLSPSNSGSVLQHHIRWSQLANITATPIVFLNGVKLPQAFQLKDVKHLGRVLKDTYTRIVPAS